MKRTIFFAVIISLSIFHNSILFAQEEKKDNSLFIIHEDVVKPAMLSQYVEASKEFVKLMKEEKADLSPQWASMSSDLHFFYVTPLKNYGALDEGNKKWSAAIKKIGEDKVNAVMEKFKGTYQYHRNFLMRRSNKYSYKPENPRLKDDEMKFLHWGFYYLEEGYDKKIEKIVKEYHDLYKSKNMANGFTIYSSDIGQPLSLMVIVEYAKSEADYYAEEEKTRKLLGDDVEPLRKEFLSLVKKYEQKSGWPRPDLGYIPEDK